MNDLLAREIFYKTEPLSQVDIRQDLCYANINSVQLHMDVYTPQGIADSVKLPTVVFIHGESSKCSSMKDTGQYTSLGKLVANSGLTAVTFNHGMLLQGFSISEIHQHIGELFNHIHAQADSLNIDEKRMAIWSISAGVPFGLYISTHNTATNSVKCAVSYYGFCDLASLADFFELDISDQDKNRFCPSIALTSGNTSGFSPMFVARAGLDHQIINRSLDAYNTQALLSNKHIDIYNHPDGQHAFDILNNNSRTHEILKKTMEFLKLHLHTQ